MSALVVMEALAFTGEWMTRCKKLILSHKEGSIMTKAEEKAKNLGAVDAARDI